MYIMKQIQICIFKTLRLRLQSALLVLFALVLSANAIAQAQVVDIGQQVSGNNSSDSNDIVLNLYLQLESLQAEVQTLRGLVEEQSYQIRRMQTESRDRYLDVDNRLSNLSSSTRSANNDAPISVRGVVMEPGQAPIDLQNQEAIPRVVPRRSTASTPTPPSSTTPSKPRNEQEVYRTALNLLVEESDYENSINMFKLYIDTYPNGRYTANAYYWQGEGLILVRRYNQAKEAFTQVINNFPKHAKAPGAMMKLVVTYINMDDMTQAQQTFQNLQQAYPDSATEIGAAKDYLSQAGN